MKAKANGYLLVVSEAQSRHVSILLSKVSQPADHPCELVNGRTEERQNERKPKLTAEATMLMHKTTVRKRGEK